MESTFSDDRVKILRSGSIEVEASPVRRRVTGGSAPREAAGVNVPAPPRPARPAPFEATLASARARLKLTGGVPGASVVATSRAAGGGRGPPSLPPSQRAAAARAPAVADLQAVRAVSDARERLRQVRKQGEGQRYDDTGAGTGAQPLSPEQRRMRQQRRAHRQLLARAAAQIGATASQMPSHAFSHDGEPHLATDGWHLPRSEPAGVDRGVSTPPQHGHDAASAPFGVPPKQSPSRAVHAAHGTDDALRRVQERLAMRLTRVPAAVTGVLDEWRHTWAASPLLGGSHLPAGVDAFGSDEEKDAILRHLTREKARLERLLEETVDQSEAAVEEALEGIAAWRDSQELECVQVEDELADVRAQLHEERQRLKVAVRTLDAVMRRDSRLH